MKDYEIIFESENIYYIKLNEQLINEYLEMVNDPEVANKISHTIRTYTYESEVEWVREKLEKNALIFSMIEKRTNEYIGNIEIMPTTDESVGEIGISITAKKQDKHYGTEAMKAIVKYGYEEIGLTGIELNVFKTNPRAIKCYENAGFVKVGEGKTSEDFRMVHKKQ